MTVLQVGGMGITSVNKMLPSKAVSQVCRGVFLYLPVQLSVSAGGVLSLLSQLLPHTELYPEEQQPMGCEEGGWGCGNNLYATRQTVSTSHDSHAEIARQTV